MDVFQKIVLFIKTGKHALKEETHSHIKTSASLLLRSSCQSLYPTSFRFWNDVAFQINTPVNESRQQTLFTTYHLRSLITEINRLEKQTRIA